MPNDEFFVSDDCNCQACRDQRKIMAQSTVVESIEDKFPFIPFNFDATKGFGNLEVESAEDLERHLNKIIAFNKEDGKRLTGLLGKSKVRYCVQCGKIHERVAEYKLMVDGKARYLCQECYDIKYFKCHKCGIIDERSLSVDVDGDAHCQRCIMHIPVCDRCKGYHYSENMNEITEGYRIPWRNICNKCYDEAIESCADCGILMSNESGQSISGLTFGISSSGDMETESESTVRVCPNCKQKHDPIKQYNYKPKPDFLYIKKKEKHRMDKFYFGVELEMEFNSLNNDNRESFAVRLNNVVGKDKMYIKADGSLCSVTGLEMVTHPMSWLEYRSNRKTWDKLFEYMNTKKATLSSGKCGMHVHINRKCFTKLHTYKFVDFMYNVMNAPFILWMSGRKDYSGNFQRYANLHMDSFLHPKQRTGIQWVKQRTGTGHHSALDITPRATYEVRIFNSMLEAPLFHKNIEFCHSLWRFTRDTSLARNNVRSYVQYLGQRNTNDQYRNLVDYIKSNSRIVSDYALHGLIK